MVVDTGPEADELAAVVAALDPPFAMGTLEGGVAGDAEAVVAPVAGEEGTPFAWASWPGGGGG